jgi:hypothetical protein
MNFGAEDEDGKAHDQLFNCEEDQHGFHIPQNFGIVDLIIYDKMEQICTLYTKTKRQKQFKAHNC